MRRDGRYWLRLLGVGVVGFVVMAWVGYNVAWVTSVTQRAPSQPCCLTPSDLGYDFEEVAFAGGDGHMLRGWYVPGDNGIVILLLHGLGTNRAAMLGRGALLAERGYGLLLYDQRAGGQSEGKWRTFGWADVRDVPPAVDFALAQEGVQQVGILGFSLGGQIALRGASADARIAAVVAEEPGFVHTGDVPRMSTLQDSYIRALYWLDLRAVSLRTREPIPEGLLQSLPAIAPRPVLYLAAGEDGSPEYEIVAHFERNTPGPSELWRVPEAAHGEIPELRTEEYVERVVGFLEREVGVGRD